MSDFKPADTVPGFRAETVTIGGVRLHYRRGGDPDGRPVLLWHGFLQTGHAWRKVMPVLAEAGLAVLVPDMRGYGDSDKPDGTNGYDARSLAEEFRSLVREIDFGGGRPLVLAAHDMGAPPALLWAADHPEEVAGLVYMEEPVLLSEVLQKIIAYTPEAMKEGSMWWWVLPLAPGVPDRLVVGHERAFLTWFFDRFTASREAIEAAAEDEYVRAFSGREGVLGSMGVYRAAFNTIEQTEKLTRHKVRTPILAVGGDKSLGADVGAMLGMVASSVEKQVIADCGHFPAEECPDEVVRHILRMVEKAK